MRDKIVHAEQARSLVQYESPIEEKLARLVLDCSPGIDVTAWYLLVPDFDEFRRSIAAAALDRHMPNFLVAPQVRVDRYRVDFMVAVRSPALLPPSHYACFAVEMDGAAFHGSLDAIKSDIERERAVRRITGYSILRFSGAEITYKAPIVGDILEAYILGAMPDPTCEAGSRRAALRQNLVAMAQELALMPSLRHEYTTEAAQIKLSMLRELVSEFPDASGVAEP